MISHTRWLRIIRDGRTMRSMQMAYKLSSTTIWNIKHGKTHRAWLDQLDEEPVKVGSDVENGRAIPWAVTAPWGPATKPVAQMKVGE